MYVSSDEWPPTCHCERFGAFPNPDPTGQGNLRLVGDCFATTNVARNDSSTSSLSSKILAWDEMQLLWVRKEGAFL
jgi:hypothetical protein